MNKPSLLRTYFIRYLLLLIAFSVWITTPLIAKAGYIGPEIPISINHYDQQNPHVIYLPDKNLWFVVWEDWRNRTTTGADIYGRLINNLGQVCGSNIIISNATGNQTAPRAAYRDGSMQDISIDTKDIIMVVWQDTRRTVNVGGFVYYRTIDVSSINTANCSGITLGAETPIAFEDDTPGPGIQSQVTSRTLPKITYDAINDRFLMAWVESRSTRKTSKFKPFAHNDAEPSWQFGDSQFVGYGARKGDLSGYQTDPTIIVQWREIKLISPPPDPPVLIDTYTRAKLLSRSSEAFKVESVYEFFDQISNLDISCDTTAHECLFVWEGIRGKFTRTDTCQDVNDNKVCDSNDVVSSAGEAKYIPANREIFGIFEKNISLNVASMQVSNSVLGAFYPAIGFDPISKRFLVAWEDTREGANKKIFGQLVYSGSGLYNQNLLISYQDTDNDDKQDPNVRDSRQTRPFVSYDPVDQRYFVIWQDGRNSNVSLENLDIYGQKVDGEGSLRGYNYPVYNLPHNQLSPTIAYNDADDIFLVVWKDGRDADKYTTNPLTCNNSGWVTGSTPCGSHVYGQMFTLGQPSLTLLRMDNTPLSPPLLRNFQNPAGSGSVEVGLFAIQRFKIRNTGDVVLKIDYIDLTCGDTNPAGSIAPFRFDGMPSELNERGGATLNLAPSAELTLTVRFTPLTDGSFNRCFIIESDGGVPKVNLSALAIASDILVTPATSSGSPYDFGNTYIGSFKEATFTVKNNGLAALKISSITNPTAPFSIHSQDCTGSIILSGNSCNIVVRFTPTALGVFNSQFIINSNDPDTPSVTVYLRGRGLGAQDITVTPLSINFGNVLVGQNAQQTITIRNDGTDALTINSINSLTPPFSIASNNCPIAPSTLAVGASCQVVVRFAPTSPGGVSSRVTISSNDPDEGTVTVNVSGTGVVIPDIRVVPSTLNFDTKPVGSVTNLNLTVSNIGAADLNITSVSNPTTPFSITANNCSGVTLSPTNSCTITVTFSPTSDGTFNSSINISSNDPDTPVFAVTILGTANIEPPDIYLDRTLMNFGEVKVGTTSLPKTVKVTNRGGSPLNITSVVYPGTPFRVTQDTCKGTSVPAGSSCVIKVVFNPTSAGLFAPYYLTIHSNDPDTPQAKVTIRGRGIP